SDPDRRIVDLAWMSFGVGNEFRKGGGWNRGIHLHDEGHVDDARDRRDIADEIEIEVAKGRCVDRIDHRGQENGVAVSCWLGDRVGGEVGGRAGSVLDDEWLAELRRQRLADEACSDVANAAAGKANNDAYRP